MSLHTIFAVVSVCLFSADVGALSYSSRPPPPVTAVPVSSQSPARPAHVSVIFPSDGECFVAVPTRNGSSELWRYMPNFTAVVEDGGSFFMMGMILLVVCLGAPYGISALDSWLSKTVDRKISSRIEHSSPGNTATRGANDDLTTYGSTSSSSERSAKQPQGSPRVMLTSGLAHNKLKDQYDEQSIKVGSSHEQLGESLKGLSALIQNLTKQGVSRDARDEKSSTQYDERFKTLESKIAEYQSRVNKDRLRIDNLYSTIRGLEGKGVTSSSAQTNTVQPVDSSAQLKRIENKYSQFEKRFDELKKADSASGNRLDELELRSRLNASIVDQLKQKMGPGFGGVEASLAVVQSKLMKTFEQQRDTLQSSISDQRSYVNSQVSLLQTRIGQAVESTENRLKAQQADLDACRRQVQDVDSPEDPLANPRVLSLERYKQKLKEIVEASKKKFDEHAARILGLEEAIYRPTKDVLPTADRLENLEYDVQKLKDGEKGDATGGVEALEQVDALQTQLESLRIDVRTALNRAVAQESHRRLLGVDEEFKQQVTSRLEAIEREKANISRQTKSFESRLRRMRNDCDGLLVKTKELVGAEVGRLSNLEAVLNKANESFSIGLVEIKQQIEFLEMGFTSLGDEMLNRITDYQRRFANNGVDPDLSFVSESDCSLSAVYGHSDAVELPASSSSAGRVRKTLNELGAIHTNGSTFQRPPIPVLDTSTSEQAQQSLDNITIRLPAGTNDYNTHGSVSAMSTLIPQNAPGAAEMASPFDSQRTNEFDNLPENWVTVMDQRVQSVEQSVRGLTELIRSGASIIAGVPDLAARPQHDQQQAATHSPRTLNSSDSNTLLPFSRSEESALEDILGLSARRNPNLAASTELSPISGQPNRPPRGGEAHQQRGREPAAWVAASGIWQLSTEEGYLLSLKTELGRFKAEIDQRISGLETAVATVNGSTNQQDPFAGPRFSSYQQSVPLAPAGSSIPPVPKSEKASTQDLTLPGHRAEWKATVGELRDELEEVRRSLRTLGASVGRESTSLSAFKREIQSKWSRQLGSLPPASMVHELTANCQELTNRLNTLEYNLRFRRLI